MGKHLIESISSDIYVFPRGTIPSLSTAALQPTAPLAGRSLRPLSPRTPWPPPAASLWTPAHPGVIPQPVASHPDGESVSKRTRSLWSVAVGEEGLGPMGKLEIPSLPTQKLPSFQNLLETSGLAAV